MVTNGMPMPLVLFSIAPIMTDTMTTTICDVVMSSSRICDPQTAVCAVRDSQMRGESGESGEEAVDAGDECVAMVVGDGQR